MLAALIRKDVRICRLPMVAGVLLLIGPFALTAMLVIRHPSWSGYNASAAWAMLLGTGCYFSLFCSFPTMAMMSGNLIAAERGDRSAEFLAYLPPTKKQILLSKFIVLASVVAVVWGGNLVIRALADWLGGDTNAARTLTDSMPPISRVAMISALAIGAGWFGSAIAHSTGPPVALAFISPLFVLGILVACQSSFLRPTEQEFPTVYSVSCVALGAVLFVLGTVCYLKRE